jgi:hypothetical protein
MDLLAAYNGAVSRSSGRRTDTTAGGPAGACGRRAAWLVYNRGPCEIVPAVSWSGNPDSEFAGLWSGSTVPGWRGRGAYRALVARRAQLAEQRG